MSEGSQSLADRRLELLQRAALQRQEIEAHVAGIQTTLGGMAAELSPARWLGASPLLLASGVALTLVLGRGRVLRTLGTGLAMVGLLRRYRDSIHVVGEVLGQLAADQSVRRSR